MKRGSPAPRSGALDLSGYAAAIFDCDGVLLDSNAVKTEAFRHVLAGEPERLVDRLLEYHWQHGGVSRYAKLRYFFEELKCADDPGELTARAVAAYGKYCRTALRMCKEVPGAHALALALSRRIPCYVLTGGDQEEVRGEFRRRELAPIFADILGSPTPKIDNIASLDAGGRLRRPAVFFGDSRSDADAAAAFGLDFVFVWGYSDWREGPGYCRARGIPVVPDLQDVARAAQSPEE